MRSDLRYVRRLSAITGVKALGASALIVALMAAVPLARGGQAPQTTIVRAGAVIDGTGNSPRQNVAIVIRDGRIAEIRGATQQLEAVPFVMKAGVVVKDDTRP